VRIKDRVRVSGEFQTCSCRYSRSDFGIWRHSDTENCLFLQINDDDYDDDDYASPRYPTIGN